MVSRELLQEYYEVSERFKAAKKRRDQLNRQIKQLIKEEPVELSEGGYKLKAYEQDRSKFNEEKVITLLKGRGLISCIKLTESVNEEALEAAIYNGQIAKRDLEPCIDRNVILALTITKEEGGIEPSTKGNKDFWNLGE